MTEPLQQRLAYVRARDPYCQVEGCNKKRHDVSRFCLNHRLNFDKWGGPLTKPASIKTINAYARAAKRFLNDYKDHHAGIIAGLNWINADLLEAGRYRGPDHSHRGLTPNERLLFYMRVLNSHGITGIDIFAMTVAHYMMAIQMPDAFDATGHPDKQNNGQYKWTGYLAAEAKLPFARQLANRIISLVKPKPYKHIVTGKKRWRKVQGNRLSPPTMDLLATFLIKRIGPLASRIAQETLERYVDTNYMKPVKGTWDAFDHPGSPAIIDKGELDYGKE